MVTATAAPGVANQEHRGASKDFRGCGESSTPPPNPSIFMQHPSVGNQDSPSAVGPNLRKA